MKSCNQFVEIEIVEAVDANFVCTKGKCEKKPRLLTITSIKYDK